MSWKWRIMQKLKRNWLVVLKLTRGTSQILTLALKSLKNLCFNWLLVTKVYIVWVTKVQRSYFSRHWRDMQILTCVLKKDLRNLTNFHQSTWKCQNWDFVQSRKGMTLKFAEELCVMTMKNNAESEEELTWHFKTDMRNLMKFDSSTQKSKIIAL